MEYKPGGIVVGRVTCTFNGEKTCSIEDMYVPHDDAEDEDICVSNNCTYHGTASESAIPGTPNPSPSPKPSGGGASSGSGGGGSLLMKDAQYNAYLDMTVKRAYLGSRDVRNNWKASLLKHTPRFVKDQVQHTALWLGDESDGVAIEFGDYKNTAWSKHNFLGESGVRMILGDLSEFAAHYSVTELVVNKEMTVKELWKAMQQRGTWTSEAYGSLTHNCNDFTNEVIDELKLSVSDAGQKGSMPAIVQSALKAQGKTKSK
jgi:hypothetical protein